MQHNAPVTLGDSIPLVYIQIHGKSIDQFLPDAWRNAKPMEDKISTTPVVTDDGKSSGSGEIFFNEDERNTSTDGLVQSLRDAGYYPVFVGSRETYSVKKGAKHKVLRYVFSRIPQSDHREREWCERLVAELVWLEDKALWKTLSPLNPFYEKDGKVVEGKNLVSIDLNGREALFNDVGLPIMRWLKDSRKQRVGDVRFQLNPAYYLGVQDGKLMKFIDVEEEKAAKARAALVAEHEAAFDNPDADDYDIEDDA